MNTNFSKKLAIKSIILIGYITLILLFSENRQTSNSNSLAQIPPFDNYPPNLLKPPKPQIQPSPATTPTPKPAEQPLVFAPPAQFRSQIVYKASISDSKVIALTFDDGPTAETLKILEVLQKHNAVATFFWVLICERILKLRNKL